MSKLVSIHYWYFSYQKAFWCFFSGVVEKICNKLFFLEGGGIKAEDFLENAANLSILNRISGCNSGRKKKKTAVVKQ